MLKDLGVFSKRGLFTLTFLACLPPTFFLAAAAPVLAGAAAGAALGYMKGRGEKIPNRRGNTTREHVFFIPKRRAISGAAATAAGETYNNRKRESIGLVVC